MPYLVFPNETAATAFSRAAWSTKTNGANGKRSKDTLWSVVPLVGGGAALEIPTVSNKVSTTAFLTVGQQALLVDSVSIAVPEQ